MLILDYEIVGELVRTPIVTFLLFSDPCERYELPYPPSYGLNSTITGFRQGCLLNQPMKINLELNKPNLLSQM